MQAGSHDVSRRVNTVMRVIVQLELRCAYIFALNNLSMYVHVHALYLYTNNKALEDKRPSLVYTYTKYIHVQGWEKNLHVQYVHEHVSSKCPVHWRRHMVHVCTCTGVHVQCTCTCMKLTSEAMLARQSSPGILMRGR